MQFFPLFMLQFNVVEFCCFLLKPLSSILVHEIQENDVDLDLD